MAQQVGEHAPGEIGKTRHRNWYGDVRIYHGGPEALPAQRPQPLGLQSRRRLSDVVGRLAPDGRAAELTQSWRTEAVGLAHSRRQAGRNTIQVVSRRYLPYRCGETKSRAVLAMDCARTRRRDVRAGGPSETFQHQDTGKYARTGASCAGSVTTESNRGPKAPPPGYGPEAAPSTGRRRARPDAQQRWPADPSSKIGS